MLQGLTYMSIYFGTEAYQSMAIVVAYRIFDVLSVEVCCGLRNTGCGAVQVAEDAELLSGFNGFDSFKKPICVSAFFERAKCMYDMRELWLSKW